MCCGVGPFLWLVWCVLGGGGCLGVVFCPRLGFVQLVASSVHDVSGLDLLCAVGVRFERGGCAGQSTVYFLCGLPLYRCVV